jgi:RNA polymerase sigma-70 factor (ECF subfamily)
MTQANRMLTVDAPPLIAPPAPASPADVPADPTRLRDAVVAHHASLWRALRRLGVAEPDVDDALQNVFMVAARKLGGVARETERAFLYGVAVRIASNARRSGRRHDEVFADAPNADATGSAPQPDEALAQLEMRRLLDHALDEMPFELRTVFVLVELEELSAPEVAALVDVPAGTVASRLRRAREAFSTIAKRMRASLARRRERS